MKRFVITAGAIGIGVIFAIALVKNTAPRKPAQTTPAQTTTTAQPPAEAPTTLPQPPEPQLQAPPVDTAFEPIEGLQVVPADVAQVSTIGSLDASRHKLQVELTGWGGGVRYIRLAEYNLTVQTQEPYVIQQPLELRESTLTADGEVEDKVTARHYPFAARAVTVNGQRLPLQSLRWGLTGPGSYTITLTDGNDQPVLRITRTYRLLDGIAGYELICRQQFENLTDQPLRIEWEQNAQADATTEGATYIGDQRYLISGYYDLEYDVDPATGKPNRQFVYAKDTFIARRAILKDLASSGFAAKTIWPNSELEQPTELVWLAMVNRYFGLAVHEYVEVDPAAPGRKFVPPLDSNFALATVRQIGKEAPKGQSDSRQLLYSLKSKPFDLAPNSTSELNLALFAGPRKSELLTQPPYAWMTFSRLLRYSLGGPCAFCTFQPLARGLLWFLKFLHSYIVFDWAVAIIVLVIVVRGILHPITKRSQINMMKMSKGMQALQPEMEKLKAKYKDNQQKLQQETMKLYKEKGVNPANILGCVPMFLQMPIWLALYSMLYFAIELRHEPAFYGIFQMFGNWQFLADLSTYDNFIKFKDGGFNMPLIGTFMPYSLNLLPLLMAVVFYYNQKLVTPPPANEQAAQQQKIMKYMVFLFPVFLYPAPSGLTLYILASTGAGIIDSYIVRKHIREQEEAGTLFDKKPRKTGGFMERMQKAVGERQRELQDKKRRLEHGKRSGGGGSGGGGSGGSGSGGGGSGGGRRKSKRR